MIAMKRLGFLVILLAVIGTGCDSIFGSKNDSTNQEIFDEGKIDPRLENVDGYAPVLPFWGDFDAPNDVHIGFDTFVYVTDNEGVHLLDRADLSPRRTIQLQGANAVTQDRLLNIYVSARIDTTIDKNGTPTTFNLPAVFKIKNMNGAGDIQFVDTLIFPFDDASLSTSAAQNARLNKSSSNNYENVEITGLTILADNSVYVSRRGPQNSTNQIAAPDNTVLEFARIEENGIPTNKMTNVRQITTLNPTNPSLRSAVRLSSIASFVTPPQRDRLTDDRSFLIAQASQSQNIDFRVLWINAVETTDGLIFEQNSSLLAQDTSQANGFLYEPGKFQMPTDIAFSGDDDAFIFVVDSETDSLYQFQSNGQEGVNPPVGADADSKKIVVSFGGEGAGPKQFMNPSGVAYYRTIVYVADTGNNRIARFKLTTDFE
ncbi:MAG: hypothetical protein JJ892_05455 [Balneola sp.]|nr:hypothetical protein [Balneola sp.]MBO6650514.1 hypothetical protein [Balneola sp.]MBO6711511.1 hypothetical protein [Balneola sp.]MBO6799707.1 hypothetical protein [Balneola sp.]MBO6870852.1 hypothetical protein [Balneola sp.]